MHTTRLPLLGTYRRVSLSGAFRQCRIPRSLSLRTERWVSYDRSKDPSCSRLRVISHIRDRTTKWGLAPYRDLSSTPYEMVCHIRHIEYPPSRFSRKYYMGGPLSDHHRLPRDLFMPVAWVDPILSSLGTVKEEHAVFRKLPHQKAE